MCLVIWSYIEYLPDTLLSDLDIWRLSHRILYSLALGLSEHIWSLVHTYTYLLRSYYFLEMNMAALVASLFHKRIFLESTDQNHLCRIHVYRTYPERLKKHLRMHSALRKRSNLDLSIRFYFNRIHYKQCRQWYFHTFDKILNVCRSFVQLVFFFHKHFKICQNVLI